MRKLKKLKVQGKEAKSQSARGRDRQVWEDQASIIGSKASKVPGSIRKSAWLSQED